MTDIAKAKYMALMGKIEDAEDQLADLEKRQAASPSDELATAIANLNEQLAADRRELARLSDGCGRAKHA